MTAHPDLAGFFADNEVERRWHRASSKSSVVWRVRSRSWGFDASETLIEEMRAGVIDSIVVQDPFKMGYESTRQMSLHLNGQATEAHIDSGAYLLEPSNVDTPEMQAVVLPDLEYWLGVGAGGH